MAAGTRTHHRVHSNPAIVSDWHARHRTLSLTARMHADIQIPPSPTQSDTADRDTGFPEPLSPHRNTTMRHPDADTSPNATIEATDIDPAPARMRYSFHREKHAYKTPRSGKITVDTSYDSLPRTDGARGCDGDGYGSAVVLEKKLPFTEGAREITESPSSFSSPASSTVMAIRHSEDLILNKTRDGAESAEGRKGGFLRRLHSLRHRTPRSRG